MRKVTLRVAISLDGFIADLHGGVDWLDRFHASNPRADYGMTEFFRSIDAILMGRTTHDFALSHGRKSWGMDTFVFTRSKPPGKRDGVEYLSGDPAELIEKLRRKPGKDIWLFGGGDLARQLLDRRLVDEICLSVIPTLLGEGIPMFQKGYPETLLRLIDCNTYKSGLVHVRYAVERGRPKQKSRSVSKKRPAKTKRPAARRR